ncbi:MAG: VOC family protein [Pseudomonadota bacterium]
MTPAILETALYVDDLEAAERFYSEILGFEVILRDKDRHVFFKLNGSVLLIFNPEVTKVPASAGIDVPVHGTTGQGHVCFTATDEELDMWKKKLEAKGIEIEREIEWFDGVRSIYFRDPSGNSLEFAQPKLWGF